MNSRDIIKIAPGVVRSFDGKRAIYTGTGDALIAAGLVERRHLPGQCGNARGMCSFDADGNPASFEPGKGRAADRTGYIQIIAKGFEWGQVYEVRLVLSAERAAAIKAERPAFEALDERAPNELRVVTARQGSRWPFPASYGVQQWGERA